MELVSTAEPHFIPGYTGYCPQYIYRIGDTYGSVTHKLLIDPCVSHSEKLTLSNRVQDDYKIIRPTMREIDLIKAHERDADAVYKHPTVPGYEGFIPNLESTVGLRYSIAATEGIAEFEKHMQKLKCEQRSLKHRTACAEKNAFFRSIGERSFQSQDYRLPLSAVRPEVEGVIRHKEKELPEAPPLPYSRETPPHFMPNDESEKYLKKGYTGHKPFAWPRFGHGSKPLTKSALCDFTNNYQHRRSAEWAPIYANPATGTSKPSGVINEIYLKNIGLMPNYAGWVPGAQFRFGKTFGNDTIDAKRWLKENL